MKNQSNWRLMDLKNFQMKRIIFCLLGLFCFANCENQTKASVQDMEKSEAREKITQKLSEEAKQLIVVTSPNDSSIQATLYRFEWKNEAWQQIDNQHPVTLGRTGLAPGKGMLSPNELSGKPKQEGDGKSPAGIFSIGTAFGYQALKAKNEINLPYTQVTEVIQCIEDGQSASYNKIINNTQVQEDWETSDFMLRDDDLYKWGFFVNHNTNPVQETSGSCIFFHLWRGPDKHTAGCTAMSENNMYTLLQWLEPDKNPRLVQLIETDYQRLQEAYGLPKLP